MCLLFTYFAITLSSCALLLDNLWHMLEPRGCSVTLCVLVGVVYRSTVFTFIALSVPNKTISFSIK